MKPSTSPIGETLVENSAVQAKRDIIDEQNAALSEVRMQTYGHHAETQHEYPVAYSAAYSAIEPQRVSVGEKFSIYTMNSMALAVMWHHGAMVLSKNPVIHGLGYLVGGAIGGINASYVIKGREAEMQPKPINLKLDLLPSGAFEKVNSLTQGRIQSHIPTPGLF